MKQELIKEMRYKVSDIHHELCVMHSKVYENRNKKSKDDSLLFDMIGAATSNIYALCNILGKMMK